MRLFDATRIPLLGKALDAYSTRQKVIAQNVANITTPGYRSKSVSFEEHLAQARQPGDVRRMQTHPKHLPVGGETGIADIQPRIHDTASDVPPDYNDMASGFNDVNIDHEMAELAKNQIRFKFGSRLLADSFKGIQKAIRGTL